MNNDQVDAIAQLLANPPPEIVQNAGPELIEVGSTLDYRRPDFDRGQLGDASISNEYSSAVATIANVPVVR